jgi:calcineurin-like phosphoesterase family protein
MDQALIDNWNARVSRNDIVYHLGDLSYHRPDKTYEIISQLNGQIVLLEGNHDKLNLKLRKRFQTVKRLHEVRIEGQKIIMRHYALMTWNGMHRGSWMLHGHSHGTLVTGCQRCGFDDGKKRLDVGTDAHNYTPIHFSEIKDIMDKRLGWVPVDHHKAVSDASG